MSSRVLTELENIDDEAENKDIVMVKVDIDLDDKHILEKLAIPNNLPKLALFEEDQPAQLFEGMYNVQFSWFRIFFRLLVSRWREVYSFWGIWGP